MCKQIFRASAGIVTGRSRLNHGGSCIELVPPLISSSLPSRPFACLCVFTLFETRPTGSDRTHVAFCAATAESFRCCLQE